MKLRTKYYYVVGRKRRCLRNTWKNPREKSRPPPESGGRFLGTPGLEVTSGVPNHTLIVYHTETLSSAGRPQEHNQDRDRIVKKNPKKELT